MRALALPALPVWGDICMTGPPRQLWRAVAIGYTSLLTSVVAGAAVIIVILVMGLSPRPAVSLPLYARQTGQPCATCHTAFLDLTPFGRRFKLGGYTLGGDDWTGPPFAVMLQAFYAHGSRTGGGRRAAFRNEQQFRPATSEPVYRREDHR